MKQKKQVKDDWRSGLLHDRLLFQFLSLLHIYSSTDEVICRPVQDQQSILSPAEKQTAAVWPSHPRLTISRVFFGCEKIKSQYYWFDCFFLFYVRKRIHTFFPAWFELEVLIHSTVNVLQRQQRRVPNNVLPNFPWIRWTVKCFPDVLWRVLGFQKNWCGCK